MTLSIAWKNIWRNKIRSLIVILAICIGIMSGVFAISVMKGMMIQRVKTAIENEVASIQIHNAAFNDNNEINFVIDSASALCNEISLQKDVVGVSKRFKIEAMFNSARSASGGYLIGIDPENEKLVSKIYTCIKDSMGNYFEKETTHPILISQKTAEILKVKVRNKIEVNCINSLGEPQKEVFKIVGIYKTSNSMFDAMNSFVLNKDLSEIVGFNPNSAHEIAILMKDNNKTDSLVAALQKKYTRYILDDKALMIAKNDSIPNEILQKLLALKSNKIYTYDEYSELLSNKLGNDLFDEYKSNLLNMSESGLNIMNWKTISPDLALTTDYLDFILFIFLGIILMALGFGIVNTMLMVVLERTRELGMLISIGMNKHKVYVMIMLETILLSLTGAVFGMFLSWVLILLTTKSGINLSAFAEGFEAIGYQSIIYPFIEIKDFISTTILVVLTGIFASIYPAWKAIRLKPAEAVRSE